jgi:RNA polymerase sigma factor (sigma-70 family)
MGGAKAPSPEHEVLRARTRGEVSADATFERLHALYAPSVRAWLLLRVRGTEAEDLVQDVWTIFYHRWRRWEQRPGMDEPEARPVLSFLYRTCHFVLKGHRRKARLEGAMDTDLADGQAGAERVLLGVEADRCLDLARKILRPEELDILLAKLAGVSAREIAGALGVTESVVDHRFRNALARVRTRLGKRGGRHA